MVEGVNDKKSEASAVETFDGEWRLSRPLLQGVIGDSVWSRYPR